MKIPKMFICSYKLPYALILLITIGFLFVICTKHGLEIHSSQKRKQGTFNLYSEITKRIERKR